MHSGWSENMSRKREKAIDELTRGRGWTNQLKDLLDNKYLGEEGLVGGEDLVVKILNSFANTLSILRNYSGGEYDEVSQKDGRRYEDSGESIKSSKQKGRRGSDKRRSKCGSSRTTDAPALIDDGHAWRKYGQKAILNTNHPRHYFRCTHSNDQLCQATKQVQQIEDNPPKYRTIYRGHHTCTNTSNFTPSDHIIMDSPSSSILISFANNGHQQETHLLSSFVKQEIIGNNKETYDHHVPIMPCDDLASSSSDFRLSMDQTTVFSPAELADFFSGAVDTIDFDALLQY